MTLPVALRRNIHLSHARQLAQLQLPLEQDIHREEPPSGLLDTVTSWVKDNPEAVRAAQESQCTSPAPDSPNWDTVFFTLMESSAIKYSEVVKAAQAARIDNLEQAIDHLEKAQEHILMLWSASLLGCTFVQLCDFVAQGPDVNPALSGAFCGLFISNNTAKPFMGIAYKGTSTTSEVLTDFLWRPIEPLRPGVVWGALLHEGWYYGLFGTFTGAEYSPQVPFDVMFQELTKAYATHNNAQLHFTGHSLGGAYCMLTYGEFLRRQSEPAFSNFAFGDMYAFGAPRCCLQPFASEVNRRTASPQGGKFAFRIVNMLDPVPTMPPSKKEQLVEYPFVHPGHAWRTRTTEGPDKMDDEPPPVEPQRKQDILANWHHHALSGYYSGWQMTPHS